MNSLLLLKGFFSKDFMMVVVNVCGIDKCDYLIHVLVRMHYFTNKAQYNPVHILGGIPYNPADTWRNNKVIDTSKPRRNVVLT